MIDDTLRTLNVLLIGETGVGKSTWINAFANYCTYDSLEDAAYDGGFFPVPSTFRVKDPQTKQQLSISTDESFMQSTKPGESVTQNPHEYAFRRNDTAINLIDTPGLLDTRDVGSSTHARDKQHVDNILKLLSAYQEIHAIFIVTKANVTRLSEAFQYTLTEIFKHLDKSACNNVVFIFTNAGSSNFKADETQSVLRRFLDDNELPIALPPEKLTIYCFENDIVKYLAECRNKIPHTEEEDDDAQRSWKRSVKTTKELLSYVSSLEPHSLTVMMSINDATNMVSKMSEILLKTMMCIFNYVKELKDKKREAEEMKEDIKRNPENFASHDLKNLLYVEETKLVTKALGHTNVVCESPKCAKTEDEQVMGRQVCCRNCKCSSFLMYFCSSTGWFGACRICGCSKSQHKWRTTETKEVKAIVYRPDSRVIDQIKDSNGALKQINEAISLFDKRVNDYSKETLQMIDICAKLIAFAHQNALLGGLAAHDELLQCLENQSTNTQREADYLEKIKSQYEQQLIMAKDYGYTVQDVQKLIKQSCRLPMKGKEIKQFVDEDAKSRRQVVEEGKKLQKKFHFEDASAITSWLGSMWASVPLESEDIKLKSTSNML